MTKWICRRCGSITELYENEQGMWFSCSNEECENNKMRREEDIDFLEYFVEGGY